MKSSLVLTLAISLAAVQCKPSASSTSSGKTLGNVAAGSNGKQQLCGYAYEGKGALPPSLVAIKDYIAIQPAEDTPFRYAVLGALAAVPAPLLKLYFVFMGGQVVIGNGKELCRATPLANSQRSLLGDSDVTSCWLAPSATTPLRMIVTPDVSLIRSSVLRLFAYWEAEHFMEGLRGASVPQPFNTPEWKAYAEAFVTERGKIAAAFLSDVKAMPQVDATKLNTFSTTDPNGFGNFIYANAVDSFYCSVATRTEFQNQFRAAWNAFVDPGSKYALAKELGQPSTWF